MSLHVDLLDDPLSASVGAAIDHLLASASNPAVLGYHARAYQAVLTPTLGDRLRHLVAFDGDAEVVGYLPFRERAAPAGRALCALPFFGPNGLVHVAPGAPHQTTERLIHGYRAAAEGALSMVLYTPFLEPIEPIAAAFGAHDRIDKFTQYLDLSTIDAWPPKRRADLKRAGAAGLSVRLARRDDLDAIIALHNASAALVGAPIKPPAYLDATLNLSLAHPTTARWTVATRAAVSDDPIGCLLTVLGPLTASYVLPAAVPAERPNQPIALLIDESVGHARRGGMRYWNMESSVAWGDSVFKFKERWGAKSGTYAILIAYPSGKAAAEAVDEADLRRWYPHYFVRPFHAITGMTQPTAINQPNAARDAGR
jgi:hypothetical protein